MSMSRSARSVDVSSVTNWLARHPRLVAMLVVLTLSVALQGAVAAADGSTCDVCVEPLGDDEKDGGP